MISPGHSASSIGTPAWSMSASRVPGSGEPRLIVGDASTRQADAQTVASVGPYRFHRAAQREQLPGQRGRERLAAAPESAAGRARPARREGEAPERRRGLDDARAELLRHRPEALLIAPGRGRRDDAPAHRERQEQLRHGHVE
jgi:hypothetical protein